MGYALLADATLVAHLLFVLFVLLGGLLVARRRRLLVPHLASAAWGAFVAASGRVCPLTPLENFFRELAGGAGYAGGFIEHYLEPILYPSGLTPGVQRAEALLVVAVNLFVYGRLCRGRGGSSKL